MSWKPFAIVCALGLAVCRPERSRAVDPIPGAGRNLASEVLAVFTARCVRCHGADLARPRGGFGYILDLKRLSANPNMIVPSRPDESDLWMLVHGDEMPPPDSPTGALTATEKEVIRAWIASGAPSAIEPMPQPSSSIRPEAPEADRPATPSLGGRTLRWLGKFHLLLLHFPIALLMVAGAGEMWLAWKGIRTPPAALRFSLVLGAIAAVPTVAMGWLYALSAHGTGIGGLIALHGWIGTAAGASVVAAAVLSERDAGRGVRGRYVRVLIPISVLLVAVAAHFGGLLVHGTNFFDW